MKPIVSRRSGSAVAFLGIWATCIAMLILSIGAAYGQDEPTSLSDSDAFRALGKERALAESYMVMLKTFAREDAGRYANGIRLYAVARAEFDGLIVQMQHDIKQGASFDGSE